MRATVLAQRTAVKPRWLVPGQVRTNLPRCKQSQVSAFPDSDNLFSALDEMTPFQGLNQLVARPSGFILEGIFALIAFPVVAALMLATGSIFFASAMAAVGLMFAVGTVMAVFSMLTLVLPLVLGAGAVTTFLAYRYLDSPDGKKWKASLEEYRAKILGPRHGASDKNDVIDIEVDYVNEMDADTKRRYSELDRELSDFDQRLRSRGRL